MSSIGKQSYIMRNVHRNRDKPSRCLPQGALCCSQTYRKNNATPTQKKIEQHAYDGPLFPDILQDDLPFILLLYSYITAIGCCSEFL